MSMHPTEIKFRVTSPFRLPITVGANTGEPLDGDYIAVPKPGSNPISYAIHKAAGGTRGEHVANAYIRVDADGLTMEVI